jgi:3-oxoacyl-[acyl-carrier protein] reductase
MCPDYRGLRRDRASCRPGLGRALVLHYHQGRQSVDRLRARIGGQAVLVQADLREEDQAEAMFAEALQTFPQIDVVVVNAGIWNARPVPLHQMTIAQWRQTLDADLTSAFLTCRAFLRHLAERPRQTASLILVGSTAAIFGEADHADYAAAKAGLTYGLTRSLKNEIVGLAPRGRVNCVCPGWTDTPMAAEQIADPQLVRQATATRPIQEIARPQDIAAAIVFLSSDALAGHISGAILPIAGGMEGRLLHP